VAKSRPAELNYEGSLPRCRRSAQHRREWAPSARQPRSSGTAPSASRRAPCSAYFSRVKHAPRLAVATKLDLSIMWVCRQRSRKRQCERKLHLCCLTFKTMPGRVGRNSCSMAPPKVKHMLTSALTGSQNSRPRHYLRRPSARQCRQVQRVSEVVVRRLISKLPATTAPACSAPLLVFARPIDGYDGGPQSMAELLRELHLRQPQPNSTAPGCSGLLGKATPPPLPQVNDVHPTMMPLVALPNGFTVHGPSKLGVGWALAFGLTAMSVMSAFAAKRTYAEVCGKVRA
jgi:hypothetical protein